MSSRLAAALRMLANERRRAILVALAGQSKDRQTLAEAAGLSRSSVTHHLTELLKHDLVCVKREGRRLLYQIGPQTTVVAGQRRAIVNVSTPGGYEATITVHLHGERS